MLSYLFSHHHVINSHRDVRIWDTNHEYEETRNLSYKHLLLFILTSFTQFLHIINTLEENTLLSQFVCFCVGSRKKHFLHCFKKTFTRKLLINLIIVQQL